jgi:hypothetical protein
MVKKPTSKGGKAKGGKAKGGNKGRTAAPARGGRSSGT